MTRIHYVIGKDRSFWSSSNLFGVHIDCPECLPNSSWNTETAFSCCDVTLGGLKVAAVILGPILFDFINLKAESGRGGFWKSCSSKTCSLTRIAYRGVQKDQRYLGVPNVWVIAMSGEKVSPLRTILWVFVGWVRYFHSLKSPQHDSISMKIVGDKLFFLLKQKRPWPRRSCVELFFFLLGFVEC